MPNRSTAGGEFGLQQALYLRSPAASQILGTGLNPVGTLVRVWGRILWTELKEDHVVYWIEDGSGLERTVGEMIDGLPQLITRRGLRVVAWADSATPVRYAENQYLQGQQVRDYVSFVGVVGADFSEDDPDGLPVPVVRVGRKQARDIFHVDGVNGQDSNNGSSWALAKQSVQAAINAASEDDEVWVKSGTYYKAANDDNVALLKDGVSLYGGFAGTEAGRWERDTASNPTILDGRYPNELPVVVVKIQDQTVTSRVDSLTAQYGHSAGIERSGGGVQCWGGSPAAVCNNVLRYNTAELGLGAGISCSDSPCFIAHNDIAYNPSDAEPSNCGGGVLLSGYPSAYVAKNSISVNRGADGGGVYIAQSEPLLRDNVILGNAADIDGGGIYIVNGGGIIEHNSIAHNRAISSSGGAIYSREAWGVLRILDNDIEENTAGYTGGGVYTYQTEIELVNNEIIENACVFAGGGAICTQGAGVILGNTFSGNLADEEGGGLLCSGTGEFTISCNAFDMNTAYAQGGAVLLSGTTGVQVTRNTFTDNNGGDRGGALSIVNSTGVDVINNLFVGNHVTGTGGGAVFAACEYPNTTSASVVNNTFVENYAYSTDPSYGKGGAVLAEGFDQQHITTLSMVNNIFFENVARDWYSGNSVFGGQYSAGSLLFTSAFSEVSDSNDYHYWNVTPGNGCYSALLQANAPPLFTNGYYLAYPGGPSYSPINMGHDRDATYYMVPLEDLDGLTRPLGSCTDMGCYETQQ